MAALFALQSVKRCATVDGIPSLVFDLILQLCYTCLEDSGRNDLFSFSESGVYHATMISYADLNCIKYTAHTKSKFDEDLTNKDKEGHDHLYSEDVFIIRMHNSNES